MSCFKLRVDLQKLSVDDILCLVEKYATTHCYCIEGNEVNPHMHFYVETDVQSPALRKSLRGLGLSGNGSYSLKTVEKNPIAYIAYMMKEKRFVQASLDRKVYAEACKYNESVKEEMKKKIESKKSVIQKIIEFLKENPKNFYKGVPCKIQLQDAILDYHRKNNLLVRRFQIQSYYDTIMLQYADNDSCRYLFG